MPEGGVPASLLSPIVAVTALLVLFAAERARPLRPPSPRSRRLLTTLAFVATAGLVTVTTYPALVIPATEYGRTHGLGVLRWVGVPAFLRPAVAFVLLDYTLWVWHWANHRIPLLWRFHAAHHADLELDVLTAWRFHFGEMLASAPFRAAQGLLLGVDLSVLLAWEVVMQLFAQVHHSNVRLPARLEGLVRRLVVTPRLHTIHHSILTEDVSSNFGTIFSVWDSLHRTHRWRMAPPPALGLPQVREPARLTPLRALALPFSGLDLSPPRVST